MAVSWQQAQARSIRHWRHILDGIGRRDAMAVVSELNELSALCDVAGQEAGGEAERCLHCVVFEDARQCAEVRLEISSLVLGGEIERARAATEAVVERIATTRVPELC